MEKSVLGPTDWNALDAERDLPRPGLLARLSLGSTRTVVKRALKDAKAASLDADSYPRARNIIEGLAERVGVTDVDAYSFDGPPNAFTGRSDRVVVALSSELLRDFTRTELEAVVAHCLVRAGAAGKRATRVGYADDVRAVALTRYPPALASALEKATPYSGRFASLYLVADSPSHRPVPERVAALQEL